MEKVNFFLLLLLFHLDTKIYQQQFLATKGYYLFIYLFIYLLFIGNKVIGRGQNTRTTKGCFLIFIYL